MKKEDSLAKRGTIFYNYRNIFYERVYFQKAVGRNGAGDVFFPVRLYFSVGRLCHRIGQRVAISLHYGKVWRRVVCFNLSGVFGDSGAAHHGSGVRGRARQLPKCGDVFRRIGTEGNEVALV